MPVIGFRDQNTASTFGPMINRTISLYKDAYSGLSSSTWWLSVVMLVNRSGTMVIAFMTIYLTLSLGETISRAGIVMGLFGLGAVVGGFLGGRLTDKLGFYPVQIGTLIGGGILFIILGQMRSYPLICVFSFLLSMVNEAFRPANATAVAHYSTEANRTRSYALNRLAINLGWAVGSAVGGVIASINYELLFWVDGITNIIAAFLMMYLLPASKNYIKPAVKIESAQPLTSAYTDRMYLLFIILTILFAACFFQMFTTLSLYMRRDLGFSERFIGLLMALNGLMITFIEMVIVFKLEGKQRNTFYIACGVLLCGLAYLMPNLVELTRSMAFMMIILITFAEIFSMPFMNSFWIGRSTPQNRGQYAGLYTIAWATAQSFGPFLGAWVADNYGFNYLWWIVGALSISAAMGFLVLHKKIGNERG